MTYYLLECDVQIMVDDRQYMICNVWNRNKQGSQSVKKKRDKNSKIAVMQTSCQNTLALFLSIIHSGRHLLLFHKRFPVRIFLQAKSLHQGYLRMKMILVPYIGCNSDNRNNRKNPCDGNVGNLSANLFLNEQFLETMNNHFLYTKRCRYQRGSLFYCVCILLSLAK